MSSSTPKTTATTTLTGGQAAVTALQPEPKTLPTAIHVGKVLPLIGKRLSPVRDVTPLLHNKIPANPSGPKRPTFGA